MDLRCPGNKLFGKYHDDYVEVRCSSVFCKPVDNPKAIVIHKWDLASGEMTTSFYKEPGERNATG